MCIRDRGAGLLHRDAYAYAPAPARCAGRLRLTPPRPHARGSAWHHLRRPVARGFEATFTFQLAAPTRRCAVHRDLDFSLALYERCAVRGGDGLAFVVADDPNGTAALGAAGGGLGYAGLRRALVVNVAERAPEKSFFTRIAIGTKVPIRIYQMPRLHMYIHGGRWALISVLGLSLIHI